MPRLVTNPDGSLALFIGGELQFDAHDEHVYHEILALPALAIVERRTTGPLRALVCGGGDGLVARELCKSPRVAHLDLVDRDDAVLALARGPLAALNGYSLTDPRVQVHATDAWAFVADGGAPYDLIIVDLTFPRDVAGADFHGIDWFEALRARLAPGGVIAANAVSPAASPDAYWAIYNALRTAALHPRPLRFALPSFAAQGYGDDWGMFLAAAEPMPAALFDDDLLLPGPRRALQGPAQLRRLFTFFAGSAARRGIVAPCPRGSDRLLQHLERPGPELAPVGHWDALACDVDPAPLPLPCPTETVLPPEVAAVLASGPSADDLVDDVLDLLPTLQRGPTRAMIATFLEAPQRFLRAVDLPALVQRLLDRARELPAHLVTELRALRESLAGRTPELVQGSMRVLALIAVVVIVGNMAYPDMVYGKGGAHGGGHSMGGFMHAGRGMSEVGQAPSLGWGPGYRGPHRGYAIDEEGSLSPARTYIGVRSNGTGESDFPDLEGDDDDDDDRRDRVSGKGVYNLSPEVDILRDGRLALDLHGAGYCVLRPRSMPLVDGKTGEVLLTLAKQPALMWRVAHEIQRQTNGMVSSIAAKERWIFWMDGLGFFPGSAGDRHALAAYAHTKKRLERALDALGPTDEPAPRPALPPVADAIELFNGAWAMPGGAGVLFQLADGTTPVLQPGQGWAPGGAPTNVAVGPLQRFLLHFLAKEDTDTQAISRRLNATKRDLAADLPELAQDRSEYYQIVAHEGAHASVSYGSTTTTASHALNLTEVAIMQAEGQIREISAQIARLPQDLEAKRALLAALTATAGTP